MAGIGTESSMYQTMMRQPDDIAGIDSIGWQDAASAAALIAAADRVILTGIGTSYHAALVGSWLLRAAGSDCVAVTSFDLASFDSIFPINPSDAVIVMAHTGVKSFSSAALNRAVDNGATVLSVGSQTAEHSGSSLILRTTPRETSAAYTSSHLTAMTVLAQVATVLGEQRGRSDTADFRRALQMLPAQISSVLDRLHEVEPIAQHVVNHQTYGIGAGPNEATALELVIKAREAAYAHVDGMAAEQFLHGPMVTVNADDLAVVIHVDGYSANRIAEISSVLDGIGVKIWTVGEPINGLENATAFSLPRLPEILSPLLTVVPMQMLAYATATAKGLDPDTFRSNNPVYKAAFSRLTL